MELNRAVVDVLLARDDADLTRIVHHADLAGEVATVLAGAPPRPRGRPPTPDRTGRPLRTTSTSSRTWRRCPTTPGRRSCTSTPGSSTPRNDGRRRWRWPAGPSRSGNGSATG